MGKVFKKLISIITTIIIAVGLSFMGLSVLQDNKASASATKYITNGGIYFLKPDDCNDDVYIYLYDDSNLVKEIAKWPGIKMDKDENLYSYELPDEWINENTKIFFYDGNNQYPSKNGPGVSFDTSGIFICDGESATVYTYIPEDILKIESFSGNIVSDNNGVNIVLNAQAEGIGSLKYRFFIYEDGKLIYKSAQSKNNNLVYKPSKNMGSYVVKVSVQDATGKYKMKSIKLSNEGIKFKIDKFNVKSDSMKVGNKINLSVSAMSPAGPSSIKYRFAIYKDKKLIYTTKLSAKDYCGFIPRKSGRYTFKVCAEYNNKAVSKTIIYDITD